MQTKPIRLAVVVSHPIQYLIPLYRRLAARPDIELKVFYTWHAAEAPTIDPGFKRVFKWDIPLTEGYEYELVPNIARDPGVHHFFGLRNPELVSRVMAWRPDAVHITGYAYASHLNAMRNFSRSGLPILFRGDSHLLNDSKRGLRWMIKHTLLKAIYKYTTVCLYVGRNNYDYFRAFGVPDRKLFYCPASIEVDRFAEPNKELEARAEAWRKELAIPDSACVLLFAGKFQEVKRPVQLMRAVAALQNLNVILVMVGNGELEGEVQALAQRLPEKFRTLPFQNQSLMPVVYRLGDIFMLPSVSETWGLAVNEALACGRRVLISNKVGCALDVVTSNEIGDVFATFDRSDFEHKLTSLLSRQPSRGHLMTLARCFDLSATEGTLCDALRQTLGRSI